MPYSLFIKILLVLTIIISACICEIKPKIHSTVLLTSSEFLVNEDDENSNNDNSNKVVTTINLEHSKQPKIVAKMSSEINQKTVDKKSDRVERNFTPLDKKVSSNNAIKSSNTSKKVATTSVQTVLTKEQEEIQWNIWRSNLQNQIMRDSKLPFIPNGIVFKFTFEVDKYGKVYNVKAWSLNPKYTPYAIQYIAPVIRGYQGHSILDFPKGSNRVITNVDGGFKISTSSSYSKPSDYNDIEALNKD